MLEGYKIVFVKASGGLWSANGSATEVEYWIGVRTVRPARCGPLGVYTDLSSAKWYTNHGQLIPGSFALYRCTFELSTDCEFWSPGSSTQRGPLGTVYANWVELTSLVGWTSGG